MAVALGCVVVFGSLLFGLGLWISLRRFLNADFFIGAADPAAFTTRLSRAHGNTAEFVPLLAVMIIYLGLQGAPALVQTMMVGATVSRVLVVIGFLTSARLTAMSLPKAVGALGTYAFGLALTAALFM
jgi:uncharacterized membrane protein YecN with MAPEG domain